MNPDRFRFPLGAAIITMFRSGGFRAPLHELMVVPADQLTPDLITLLETPQPFPCWSIHIALGDISLLVDPGRYNVPPGDPWSLPPDDIPPDLARQLAAIGIAPTSITHVVITHPHDDHYDGAVYQDAAGLAPAFPNARHYLSRADWDDPDFCLSLADPDSPARRVLGHLHAWGLLDLVDGATSLAAGIDLLPAPGETPGHQIVRVHSQGRTLYCLGDLYHHVLEAQHPGWTAEWSDAAAARQSRDRLAPRALAEDALLIATHIPAPGRLRRLPSGLEWQITEEWGW